MPFKNSSGNFDLDGFSKVTFGTVNSSPALLNLNTFLFILTVKILHFQLCERPRMRREENCALKSLLEKKVRIKDQLTKH